MKQRLHVTVTQEDIDSGVPGDEQHCAIALATKREMKRLKLRSVAETVPFDAFPAMVLTFAKIFDREPAAKHILKPIKFSVTLDVEPRPEKP